MRYLRSVTLLIVVMCLSMIGIGEAFAQSSSAIVEGTVEAYDMFDGRETVDGFPLSGSSVTVVVLNSRGTTVARVKTDQASKFRVNLTPGTYSFKATWGPSRTPATSANYPVTLRAWSQPYKIRLLLPGYTQ